MTMLEEQTPHEPRATIRERLATLPRVDINGIPVTPVIEEPTQEPRAAALAPAEPEPSRPQPDPSQGQQGTTWTITPTNPIERVRAQLRKGTR